ncbi:MAG: ABC transporter ATP-binding protein [Deltaproteobacteria bacterium]|nr:ABC transporter ATP-binding protein [Deltaproteobacteria bacterium]
MASRKDILLDVKNLKTSFFTKKGVIKAVDDVSFTVKKGEVIGLVGESGSGKSVTSLSIMRLVPQPAGKIVSGEIIFNNENLLNKSETEMRELRGNNISMILQDPMVSLNQLLTVGYQIGETFKHHGKADGNLLDKCINVLKKVRVPSPETRVNNYPFQFSGGMCQRVLIGTGIANNPELLIADEPTTALDVTIQAQILQLMKDLRNETNASIILITHDLATIAQICTKVYVMYGGRIVEKAPIKDFYKNPQHPYSEGLIKSVPVLGKRVKRLFAIEGQPPNLLHPPPGCRFEPRCTKAKKVCSQKYPPEIELKKDHQVSCWLYG